MSESEQSVRAYGLTEYGGPEVMREVWLRREPLPAGQVRLRVTAVAVSPTDTMLRSGARAVADRPAGAADVPGTEAAGEVVEIGPGVLTVAVGDRVLAMVVPSGEHGAYRTDLVVPEQSVVPVPSVSSDAEAATLPMNGLTAWLALDTLALPPGAVLAVTGAAGIFGGYVVQLAKNAGLTVVADASEGDAKLVDELGADVVLPRGPGFAAAVRDLYPDGVDGLADGAVQGAEVFDAVKDGGVVVTLRGYAGDGARGLRVTPVSVATVAERRDVLLELRALVERGALTLRVADVLPAGDVAEAHRRLGAGGVRGRLVLDLT